jgi:hypothetical protein
MNFSIRLVQNLSRINNSKIIRSLSSNIKFAQTHEYIKVYIYIFNVKYNLFIYIFIY